jgi:hypothetical protein
LVIKDFGASSVFRDISSTISAISAEGDFG